MSEDTAQYTIKDGADPTRRDRSFIGMMRSHPKVLAMLIAAVIVAAFVGWQSLQHKRDLRIAQSEYLQSVNTLRTEMLLLIAKSTVWSLRTELLRGNQEQVQFLIDDLVKDGNFVFIHVVDPTGTIVATSDRALRGKPAGADISSRSLQSVHPLCEPDGDTRVLVSAPVMGIDRKIASLVFAYSVR